MKKILFWVLCMVLVLGISGCVSQNGEQMGDSSLSEVMERGKLVVGAYEKIEPMSFLDEDGNNVGHEIDLAREIASKLGVSLEIKEMFFPELFAAVESGEIDIIISAITITAGRQEEMLFSIPYFDAGQVILVRRDESGIRDPEDLENRKVGVLKGTTGEETAKSLEHINMSMLVVYDKIENRTMSFEEDGLDAMIEDYVGATGVVKNEPSLKIVGDPFTQEYYGVVTRLGNEALMEEINGILRDMKRSGKLEEIKDRWMG